MSSMLRRSSIHLTGRPPPERQKRDQNLLRIDEYLRAKSAADIRRNHTDRLFGKIQLRGDLPPHQMRHLCRRPDGENIRLGFDPRDDAAAFKGRGAIPMVPKTLAQSVGRIPQRLIDVSLVHLKAEYDVILGLVMDQGRAVL
jgi:hypothetical protein